MKATELMIGDWVRIENYLPERYTQEFVRISLNDFLCENDGLGGFDEYEPIPLTAEILEKNGIMCQYGDPWYQYHDRKPMIVCDNKIIALQLVVEHVHTLQHALRLCGLNDMADKFKIN